MQFPEASIDNLRSFGYTADEARSLYLVATHSGYFSARQFLQFTGAKSGATRPTHFEAAQKLFSDLVNRAPDIDPGE